MSIIFLDRISEERDYFRSCSEEFGDYLFPVEGQSIGVDHAHPLYGGICRIVPEFHESNSIGIFGINGKLGGAYSKRLNIDEESVLRIRLPLDLSRSIYKLAGKTLQIHQDKIYLGIPELELIVPSQNLEARIVTIKGFLDASTFETAVQNHLDRLEIGLLREVISEVLVDRLKSLDQSLDHNTIIAFFDLKCEQEQSVSRWSKSTYQKVCSNTILILV